MLVLGLRMRRGSCAGAQGGGWSASEKGGNMRGAYWQQGHSAGQGSKGKKGKGMGIEASIGVNG